ncbi:MAG: protein-L-isoaspartate(D-aspartate) O-methyltransferase [Saprospiraceae bacterium]|nr:protein-L-isoaspartate(D-aspartate) O-methyltransferase [Saprospiraceae bacterium]
MKDTYRHKGLRKQLVDGLKSKGIDDEAVLQAIGKVPRHCFLNSAFDEWAYRDVAFPIESGQTISQPLTVAIQTSLLNVKKGDKVLEIGTGSGYQASVLVELGAKVFTLERDEHLYKTTSELLNKLGYTGIRTYLRDGFDGLPRHAPYDKILVTAAAPEIPDKLLEQLTIGGCMVIPVGKGDIQNMIRITRVDEDKYDKEDFGKFRFVPFVKGIKKEKDSN